MTLVNFPDENSALPSNAGQYDKLFQQAAINSKLAQRLGSMAHAVNLLKALAIQESRMNPQAISPINKNGTRNHGIMQINDINLRPNENIYDPAYNINRGAELFNWALDRSNDDISAALSIYNRGHYGERGEEGMFPNQDYVDSVRAIFSKLMAPTVDKLAQSSQQGNLGPNLTAASVGPQ